MAEQTSAEIMNEDIAGVQGDDQPAAIEAAAPAAAPAITAEAPAPDAAEIEWAGGAIVRPPRPPA